MTTDAQKALDAINSALSRNLENAEEYGGAKFCCYMALHTHKDVIRKALKEYNDRDNNN